jgi:hypothetical protein
MRFFRKLLESIGEINRRYAKPEIEMTFMVRICLLVLRLYLITLVLLILFKFAASVGK